MNSPIAFDGEEKSNQIRASIEHDEPRGLRTYTPSLAVIARSSGLYHWTADGRKLADFSSGVLVTNLGHTPRRWLERLRHYMGWTEEALTTHDEYVVASPLTAYNAISTIENTANHRLLSSLRSTKYGARMQQVMWAASGSEAIQKSLWAALQFQPNKDVILATRDGFHGKKGLAGAVTGDERSPDRDPRVQFISFPKEECRDELERERPIELESYRLELEKLRHHFHGRINCLITEPYLGGGGSYHPQPAYLQMLVQFCRENDIVFILDEVQSNFGRTGSMYAFETYGIEPDVVVLGKGMGNGIPVNAAVGRRDVFASLGYGGASDTWSAHPLGCAATLATLDTFEHEKVMEHAARVASVFAEGLRKLKNLTIVNALRGEGFVWGIEMADHAGWSANDVAIECVRSAYLGDSEGNAIHLLGPLAGKVIRISPPVTITMEQAKHWTDVLYHLLAGVQHRLELASNAVA